MIILHDADLTRVFRESFAKHADKIQETLLLLVKALLSCRASRVVLSVSHQLEIIRLR